MRILFVASIAERRDRFDGETIKNRAFMNFLRNEKDIQLRVVDTDNFRKFPVRVASKILYFLPRHKKIIISCSDQGAHILLKFMRIFNIKKEIYYFVVGGRLASRVSKNGWPISDYEIAKKIYVESDALKNELLQKGLSNVELAHNFRNVKKIERTYRTKPGTVRFIFYGRIIKEKGIEEAIKLIKKLNENKVLSTLDFYGQVDKEYLNYLQTICNKHITYKGAIKPDGKTEYEILSSYDVFIFPTEYPGECMPGSIIDARIAGLPILASDWKYAKEFINDGVDGLIFDYKNYDDMCKKAKILLNSSYRSRLAENSAKRSTEYISSEVLSAPMSEIRSTL